MLNIIICGTPGTGKSTLIERLKPELEEFNFLNLSKYAMENECTSGFDETLETHILDEDKLLAHIGPLLEEKKFNIIECIHPDIFSEDQIDWVYVCRTDNTILYDRLKTRGYNTEKISNNVEAEIFRTIYDEASEGFGDSVTELFSNEIKDLDKNAKIVIENVKNLLLKKG